MVKVGEKVEKKFQTEKKVRQECPLSPMLFNLLIADIEKEFGKDEVKGGENKGKKTEDMRMIWQYWQKRRA